MVVCCCTSETSYYLNYIDYSIFYIHVNGKLSIKDKTLGRSILVFCYILNELHSSLVFYCLTNIYSGRALLFKAPSVYFSLKVIAKVPCIPVSFSFFNASLSSSSTAFTSL